MTGPGPAPATFGKVNMLIRLRTPITTAGPSFLEGDLVDWPDGEAERLVERGLAERPAAEEARGQKAKKYAPPKARPEDRWPPAPRRRARAEVGIES